MASCVVVTGGAGYVGSHAAKALAARGWHVVVIDNLSRGFREAVRCGPLEVVDVRDQSAVLAVLKRHRPSTVMHFAAFAYVGESVEKPALYFDNNVTGALSLLGAMLEAGCKRFVFSSTCAVYGHPRSPAIREDHVLAPVNPYGWTKLTVERALATYADAYDLRSVSLRYFNAAGADPDLELGERHDPETHLIPRALDVAAGRVAALPVYGTDYETPDGTCVRDYVHVSDLAAAHADAVEYLEKGGGTIALNLGSGKGHSVLDLVKEIERITQRPVARDFAPRRPGDPAVLVADAGRAREVLGWTARRSDLSTILSHAWAWHSRVGERN